MAQKTPYFLTLEREKQCKALEAVIFASDDPITQKDLFRFLILEDFNQSQVNDGNGESSEQKDELWGTFTPEYFDELVAEINKDLDFSSRPFRIVNIGGGFQFATTPQYGEYVHRLLKSKSRKRLSQAALETLAIIAYKQPTTRAEIDSIRGVNSGEVVNALLEKNLVVISGRAETIGKPLLYSTSDEFLRVFGINKISDLPKLREIDELMEQNPQGALIAAMEEMNKDASSQENEESEKSGESESEMNISDSEDAEISPIEEGETEVEIVPETEESVIDSANEPIIESQSDGSVEDENVGTSEVVTVEDAETVLKDIAQESDEVKAETEE